MADAKDLVFTEKLVELLGGATLILDTMEMARKNQSKETIRVDHHLYGGKLEIALTFDESIKWPPPGDKHEDSNHNQ